MHVECRGGYGQVRSPPPLQTGGLRAPQRSANRPTRATGGACAVRRARSLPSLRPRHGFADPIGTNERPGETHVSPGQAGAPATLPPTGHPSPLFGSRKVRLPPSPSHVRSDGAGVLLAGSRSTTGLLRALSVPGLCSSRIEQKLRPIFSFGPPGSSCPKLPADPGAASRRGRVEVAGPRPVGPTAPSRHRTIPPREGARVSGKTGSGL